MFDLRSVSKRKQKKYLLFDNWEVTDATANMIVKNYTIKVPKNSKLTYAGIEVNKKYIDKEESTKKLDVYVLPYVFTASVEVKASLSNGLEIKNQVTPSNYKSSYEVSFNPENLTSDEKKKIVSDTESILNTIYQNAIVSKPFAEIKSTYQRKDADIDSIEKSYNSFVKKLASRSTKLKTIEFTDVTLSDIDLTEDNFLEVRVKAEYDYSVEYENWKDEVKTSEKSSYSSMTITIGYDKDQYYLVDFDDDDLTVYFYS